MHMLSTLSLLGASENASQAGGRRRADDIYRTASKSSAAAVSSTRPLGGRDGPGCRDSACLSSSRSARPQAAASPTSVATMVNACVQSPTEPGVTMACSSLLGGVCRAEYGEVASVTCEGPQFFLGFNCEFVQLGQSPGGRHGYSVGVALRRGWWQLRRPFMAQCPCPGSIGLAAPGRPVRSLVARTGGVRDRTGPDRGPCWFCGAPGTIGTSGSTVVTKGTRTAGRSAFGSSSAHNAKEGIRLWFRRSPAQGSCDTDRLV
jgi:hypothetical protein